MNIIEDILLKSATAPVKVNKDKSYQSVHTELIDGFLITIPNTVTKQEKTYHVSYNSIDTEVYGCDTTALHIIETGQYLVLNGNHTNGYDNCSTLEECIAYFYDNVEHANKLSEHGRLIELVDGKYKAVKGGY